MRFDKMHGLGNDFVVVNFDENVVPKNSECIRRICNRKFGVGCDTLVLYSVDENAKLLHVEFFNADGSPAEICGNASRCLGLLMNMRKNWDSFQIVACEKNYAVTFRSEKYISVNMGRPNFTSKSLGIANENCDMLNVGSSIGMFNVDAACVSVGNPHLAIFSPVDDMENIGSTLNNRRFFCDGINVSFAKVVDRNTINLRVFERGCGLTLACGSGACATGYLAFKKGLTTDDIIVRQPGGDLKILIENDGSIIQTGSATYVFCGEISL